MNNSNDNNNNNKPANMRALFGQTLSLPVGRPASGGRVTLEKYRRFSETTGSLMRFATS
jgi:hypothetical protein